jgi:hypothetical protein
VAENLKRALGMLNVPESEIALIPVGAYDPSGLITRVEKRLAALDSKGGWSVMADVTGGTKLMSFALLVLAGRHKNWNTQYLATERRRIYRGLMNSEPHHLSLDKQVPLDVYLAAHGFTAVRTSPKVPPPSLSYLTQDLRRSGQALQELRTGRELPRRGGTLSVPLTALGADSTTFFRELARAGCGNVTPEGIQFSWEECKLLWGDWLEMYTQSVLQQMQHERQFAQVCGPMALYDSKGRLAREIDGAAIFQGRLAVFSCKQPSGLKKAFYDNLQATRKELGAYATLFFVTTFDVPPGTVEGQRSQGIEIVGVDRLGRLAEVVQETLQRPLPAL